MLRGSRTHTIAHFTFCLQIPTSHLPGGASPVTPALETCHIRHLCAHTEVTPAVGSPQQLCHCPPLLPCRPPAGGSHTQLCQLFLVSALLSPCPYFHICQGTSDPSCPKSPKLVISSREVHKRGVVQDTSPGEM